MKMKAPKGCTGVSVGGEELVMSKRGIVDVSPEAAAELVSHGFKPMDDETAAADGDQGLDNAAQSTL